MSFILEVEIPDERETKQFEFPTRATVDAVKDKIFKNTARLHQENRVNYVLQLIKTEELLLVEFVKILATEELRARAEDGLPIQVRLILRDQADRFLRKQIHFVDTTIVERKERMKRIKSEVFTSTKIEIPEFTEKMVEKIQEIEKNQEKTPEKKKKTEQPRKMRKQLSFNNEFHKLKSTENLAITKIDKKLEINAKNSNVIANSPKKPKKGVFIQNFLDSDEGDKQTSETASQQDAKRINRHSVVSFQFSNEELAKLERIPSTGSVGSQDSQNSEIIIEISAPPPSSPLVSHSESVNPSPKLRSKSPENVKNKKLDKLQESEKKKRSSLNSSSANSILFNLPAATGSRLRNSVKLPNFSAASKNIKILHQDQPESTYFDFYQTPSLTTEENELVSKENGYYIEAGNSALPLEKFNQNLFVISALPQINLYTKYFVNKEHVNYIGRDEIEGPVIISMIEEKEKGTTRALVRLSNKTHHICVENPSHSTSSSSSHSLASFSSSPTFFKSNLTSPNNVRTILSKINLSTPKKSLKKIKNPNLVKELTTFDQSHLITNYKFGVLYCKENQYIDNEWFSNEHGSEEFNEFLEIVGEKIVLFGWNKFRAGLDVKFNATGLHSIFSEYKDNSIMFHVSTLLPFSPADPQNIERKRHIGNDIVVIIYKEGNSKFPASACKSVFNHIFIVVQKHDSEYYKLALVIKDGVKPFGPPLPPSGLIHKSLLREYLLVKMINAEWAAYRSTEFSHKFKRTRNQQLESIINTYKDS